MTFCRRRPPGPSNYGGEHAGWRGWLTLGFSLVLALAPPLPAQARAPRVALVLDRDSPRFHPLIAAFQREVGSFFRPGEIELLPPVAGDGTAKGVAAVLDGTLRDPAVSIVVTLGVVGSHLLATGGSPPKPAIAGMIVDAAWQGIPQREGTSGVRRLTYVDQSYPVGQTLADFFRLIPFHKLAVLLDRDMLQAVPQLASGAAGLVRAAGGEAAIVAAGGNADSILASLPSGVDAVYLTPLGAMSEAEYTKLLDGLTTRRLPTLSYMANPDVHQGALASYEPAENWQRRSRRVAVDLQRILGGEDPGTLPVQLVSAPKLTLNLAVARRIGYSPGRIVLTDAELVGADSAGPPDTLTLSEAMRGAVATNLDLAAANLDVASGREDVHLARANLLPEIDSRLTQTWTRPATAAASLGQQPQRLLEGAATFSMPLYAEQAWAGYSSQQSLQRAREAQRDQLRLDVVLDAATAFLTTLEAQTLADVERSNLYRTRSNLEVARLREGVGTSSRADVYRWEGEVANARRDLISAESQVRVAVLELKRLLDRPLARPLAQHPVTLGDPALLASDSTVLTWFDDPVRFSQLTNFLVDESLRISPELAQAEASIAAQRRQRTAAGRAFWLPTFSLQGGLFDVFNRGGQGSSPPPLPPSFSFPRPPDLTWQVQAQASLPLFTGFSRVATRNQTGFELDRLEVQRDAIRLAVDQRVRAALETAASAYTAIQLTRDAAEAANRNYDLVSDSYANGAVGITTVLDAQSAALSSSEAAANAVHDFLLNLMQVERAMGTFGALQLPEQRQAFLERLRAAVGRQAP
jgi:outer membrane protein TolC